MPRKPKLLLCRKCAKPKRAKVKGRPQKGKTLCRKLAKRDDLEVEIVPCKCLGKCKKGPNATLLPGEKLLHRITAKKIEKLFSVKVGQARAD
ncbi:MAG: (2Fe-2S) ferredoxin domain-containing protein [Verrucomicrobiota bacterium]